MSADNCVQDARISEKMKDLHGALISIVSTMNRPQRDEQLIAAAGIRLDRALFPLLVLIERLGPIGVTDLGDRVGRDHSTVSRQIAKMEALELVGRQANPHDRRAREAVILPKGKEFSDRIDLARERMAQTIFSQWPQHDIEQLTALMCRFATALDEASFPEP